MTRISTDTVASLTAQVNEFSQQQSQQDLFSALRSQAEALDGPIDELANLAELFSQTALGDGVELDLSNASSALQTLDLYIGDDWDARELQESGALPSLRAETDRLLDSIAGKIKEAWLEYIADNPIPRVGELASLLRALDIEAISFLKVENAVNRLTRSAAKPYPSLDEFEKYRSDLKTAQEGAMKIGLDGSWPVSVTNFLRDVADLGADLSRLEPDVLEWLDERGLTSHFLIVPNSDS